MARNLPGSNVSIGLAGGTVGLATGTGTGTGEPTPIGVALAVSLVFATLLARALPRHGLVLLAYGLTVRLQPA